MQKIDVVINFFSEKFKVSEAFVESWLLSCFDNDHNSRPELIPESEWSDSYLNGLHYYGWPPKLYLEYKEIKMYQKTKQDLIDGKFRSR